MIANQLGKRWKSKPFSFPTTESHAKRAVSFSRSQRHPLITVAAHAPGKAVGLRLCVFVDYDMKWILTIYVLEPGNYRLYSSTSKFQTPLVPASWTQMFIVQSQMLYKAATSQIQCALQANKRKNCDSCAICSGDSAYGLVPVQPLHHRCALIYGCTMNDVHIL